MKYLAFLLMLFACCMFTACGDDDDDEGGNGGNATATNATLTIGDRTVKFTNVFWGCVEGEGPNGENLYSIMFYSFDLLSAWSANDMSRVPEKYSSLEISYYADGSTNELPEITTSSFVCRGALDWQRKNGEYMEYGYFEKDSNTTLVVSKSDGKTTLTIDPFHVKYSEDDGYFEGKSEKFTTSFIYTGNIAYSSYLSEYY